MYRILFTLSIVIILASCQTVQNEKQANEYDHWLEGTWTAPYFMGKISETWSFNDKGNLSLDGLFEENGDTIYWEKIKIDTLGKDIFLIAKPHNSPGFIYQQVSSSENEIVFENKIYSNPYRIKYIKVDNDHFDRVNIGLEEGQEVKNLFNYTRLGKLPLVPNAGQPFQNENIQDAPVMIKKAKK